MKKNKEVSTERIFDMIVSAIKKNGLNYNIDDDWLEEYDEWNYPSEKVKLCLIEKEAIKHRKFNQSILFYIVPPDNATEGELCKDCYQYVFQVGINTKTGVFGVPCTVMKEKDPDWGYFALLVDDLK